jgi:PAS domain S-box-containing protein
MPISIHCAIQLRAMRPHHESPSRAASAEAGVPDLFIRLDHEGKVLECKMGGGALPFVRVTSNGGATPEIAVTHVNGQFRAAVARVISRGEMEAIEYAIEQFGRVNYFEARLAPLDQQVVAFVHDITARKRAEEELFESREMLRMIVDTVPLGVFWKDRNSVYLGCNRRLATDVGFSDPANIVGKTDFDTDAAQTAEIYRADDQLVMRSDQPKLNYEEPQDRGDGTRGWLRTSKVPLHDRDGRVIGILGTYEDITDRKHAEAMRVAENKILETIATGAPLEATLRELALIVESQSPGTRCSVLLLEASAPELRMAAAPSLPEDFVRAIDRLAVGEGMTVCGSAAARKQLVVAGDVRTDPLCGPYRDLAERTGIRACWAAPIMSAHEEVLGTFAMYCRHARGPTSAEQQLVRFASHIAGLAIQRRRAEEALRTAEEKYRNIFENALDGIFQISPEGRVLEANPAFARMFGYESAAELIASVRDVAQQLCLPPSRYTEFAQALQAAGVVQRWELPMRGRAEGVMWVSIDARLAKAADGRTLCYEGIAKDVTERKRLEQQFLQAQKMEAFGQLAGGVAHDFNNLLTVILGNLSLIRLGDLPPAHSQVAIDDCFRSAQRAANLTSQLLTFSRRQPVEPKDLDLSEVVANLSKMLQPIIGEHIALETSFAPEGARVRADPGMIEQAVMNLALNARDAMPKGGKLKMSTASINLDAAAAWATSRGRPGSFVRLTVADTGAGIAPEHLPHIFEPFFTTKEVGKGTGLGLATVFGIVEQHEGWIEVESAPGAGTTMHVFLPRIVGGTRAGFAAESGARHPRGGSETILLVEDEGDVRALMSKLLERHGYQVHLATDGASALKRWAGHCDKIDLLVTDMVMPGGVGGRELAERLRAEKPDLKVVFCSGYTDEILGDLRLRGSENFLEKPFDVHAFLGRVRACLDA